jgi:ISXO2-like transposase domain
MVDGGWWQMRDGLRRCAVCRSEASVTAGKIFAGTRTPLVRWFAAMWYVVNQKQGVPALGLQRVLGLGSYQTAWSWLHKLRRAMVLPGRELLSGTVEIDETYVGARHTSVGGRSPGHKAIVAIAVEGDQAPERVRMRRIPDVKQDTLTDFVLDHVARGSEVRPTPGRAMTTSAATASATSSPTCRPAATRRTSCSRMCIWSPR